MVARMLSALVVFHYIFEPGSCCGKKQEVKMGPSYHVHPNDTLPSDLQIATFLLKGEGKRFFYISPTDSLPLTLTLTTCTSPISWSFSPTNTATSPFLTNTTSTHHFPPAKGTFTLHLLALEQDSFAHIYVSTELGGPQTLQKAKSVNIRLLKRQKGKRLTVKWNPSLVDPQGTDYCLITTTAPRSPTLCAAQLAAPSNTTVTCTGSRTQHTITDLTHLQRYYFSIWAINHQSNFTYPYGTTSTIFDGRFRHTSLKDGKPAFANLKQLDGKAVFRYKVSENNTKALDLFIIPCGGVIDVEVALKDVKIVRPKRVESFGRVTIEHPVAAARYYVKIFASNREELKKSSGVEIYATTKYPAKIPLPSMPEVLKVQEYRSLTTCDTVTVGWVVAPSPKTVHYCLSAKEGKIREMEEYRMPNQCGLENRLKKSTDFVVKYCTDVKPDKESVVVQKIGQLKPNRHYIIQVTVKKPKGKTLSYDLLQVRTRPSCKKKNLD